jgi:hypothetical protein
MPNALYYGDGGSSSRQQFKNTTNDDIFVTLEPWCWRYRLKPSDMFEIKFSLECRVKNWVPLEIHIGAEGDKVGLFIFVNGDDEPMMLINGNAATEDYSM